VLPPRFSSVRSTDGVVARPFIARSLDAEAGLGGNPAGILELVADEAVSAGWERLKGWHGAAAV
jgi:hypothetical protein